jgi:hypothetical protein
VISRSHGGRRFRPYVFTEHGVLMAANVLNSPRAVAVSVALIKTFVRLREVLATNQVVAKRLAEVEKTLVTHDAVLRDIYLRTKPAPPASARSAQQKDRILRSNLEVTNGDLKLSKKRTRRKQRGIERRFAHL